eukprot:79102-Rhodomonas_salina.1
MFKNEPLTMTHRRSTGSQDATVARASQYLRAVESLGDLSLTVCYRIPGPEYGMRRTTVRWTTEQYAGCEDDTSPLPSTCVRMKQKRSIGECIVCLDKQADVQLRPCRHEPMCRGCAMVLVTQQKKLTAPCCPLCRCQFEMAVLLGV